MGEETLTVKFSPAHNVATLGGASLVFHCHFYNCALQSALEEGLGADAAAVQAAAAQECVRQQLEQLVFSQPLERALEIAPRLFGELGFGTLELDGLRRLGGRVVAPHSHYAMGWLATRGERSSPCCHFVRGFIAAAACAAFQHAPERVRVSETECFACGAERCVFDVEVG